MRAANEQLWKLCFGDSDEFIKLYFDRRATHRNTMAAWQQNRLAAALQMLPYSITFPAEVVPVSYISGACTHPDFRKRGIMRNLLARTHRRMAADGAWFSFLIPAEPHLWHYYAKSGYTTAFWHVIQTGKIPNLQDNDFTIRQIKTNEEADVFPFFSTHMQRRPYCIQHDKDDFQTIIADLRLSGGNVWLAEQGGQVAGLLFAAPQTDCLQVTELIADNEMVKNCLLATAGKHYQQEKFRLSRPAGASDSGEPLGMARVLRPLELLQAYAQNHPERQEAFQLSDADLLENEGVYIIKNGNCRKTAEPQPGARQVGPRELGEIVFAELRAFMSLMLN